VSTSDNRQFEPLREGDETACLRFVREHYEGLYRWLYRLTGRRHWAEDLTQESFAAFWESLKRTTPHTSARTWLYSIARNVWRKDCRSRRAARQSEGDHLDEMASSSAGPPALLEEREFADALEAAVGELSPEFREVFSLRLWHEFDYAQIAAVQGISPDLARWRFFRARGRIRDRLRAWQNAEEKCRGK